MPEVSISLKSVFARDVAEGGALTSALNIPERYRPDFRCRHGRLTEADAIDVGHAERNKGCCSGNGDYANTVVLYLDSVGTVRAEQGRPSDKENQMAGRFLKWITKLPPTRTRDMTRAVRKPKYGLPSKLYGQFELRGTRLVGWVKRQEGFDNVDLHVEFLSRGVSIDNVHATPEAHMNRFSFTYDAAGKFTGRELLNEIVTVRAYDSEGSVGRILLDGATQLELIREHMGLPIDVIFDLDFSRNGNASSYLGAGWSLAQPDFTFTLDQDSYITFATPTAVGTYVLRFTAGAFLSKPFLPEQELTISINGAEIRRIYYTEGHPQYNEVRFHSELFGGVATSTIRLFHPNAARPIDLKVNPDNRKLAFFFKRLVLARLLNVPQI